MQSCVRVMRNITNDRAQHSKPAETEKVSAYQLLLYYRKTGSSVDTSLFIARSITAKHTKLKSNQLNRLSVKDDVAVVVVEVDDLRRARFRLRADGNAVGTANPLSSCIGVAGVGVPTLELEIAADDALPALDDEELCAALRGIGLVLADAEASSLGRFLCPIEEDFTDCGRALDEAASSSAAVRF